jgi:hypothetical protein
MWWHYVMGKIFELRTNHGGLKYLFGQPSLNARQIRWLEFLSEYDFDINHIKGKENKVAATLNRRAHEMHATTISTCKSDLCDNILEVAKSDLRYDDIKATLQQGMSHQNLEGYELREDGILVYRCRVYVSNDQELKTLILLEIHKVPFVGHPGYQKTIVIVKDQYFWPDMKNKVAYFIARCLECQKIKDEHIYPTSLLQPLPIPEWKWEVVTMEFITKLSRTANQQDYIMVVVDKLTKSSHFVQMKSSQKETNIVDIYMREISKLHGVPKTIVSDRDSKFTSNFWKGIFKGFGASLNFSTTHHPESDGQTERVNQVIEDMLRMYVIDKPSKWEYYLHLVEFAYNNGCQASLKMNPFEALYGRKCKLHACELG